MTPSAPLRRARVVLVAVILAYALLIVFVAAYPGPIDRPFERAILLMLKAAHGWGLPAAFSYATVEFLANVAFYVPIAAAAAAVLTARRRVWVIVGLAGVSTCIELIQSQMPHRVGSVLDVAANTLGAAIGVGSVWLVDQLRVRRAARRDVVLEPV